MQPSRGFVPKKNTISCCGNYRWDESFKVFFHEFFSMLSLRRGKIAEGWRQFPGFQNVAVSAFTMILHLAVLQRSPTCHHVFSNVVGPLKKKRANMCTVQSEKYWIPAHVLLVCHQLKNKVTILLQITQMSYAFPSCLLGTWMIWISKIRKDLLNA